MSKRGRHWYPKIKIACKCGWKGVRTTFMARKPCPRCGARGSELGRVCSQECHDAAYLKYHQQKENR